MTIASAKVAETEKETDRQTGRHRVDSGRHSAKVNLIMGMRQESIREEMQTEENIKRIEIMSRWS